MPDQTLDPAQTAQIASRLRQLYVAAVYDIMDEMGLPNQCLALGIRPLQPTMKVAGPAFTMVGGPDPRTNEEYDDVPVARNFEFFKLLTDGCVIVLDAGGEHQCGHWGELMSNVARQRRASGIVIDGGIRDSALVCEIPGWSAFARYTSPIESRLRYRIRAVERPIAMSGTLSSQVRVEPGDWIFGDADGVVVIPRARLEEILTRAEAMEDIEAKARAEIQRGVDFTDVLERYGRM